MGFERHLCAGTCALVRPTEAMANRAALQLGFGQRRRSAKEPIDLGVPIHEFTAGGFCDGSREGAERTEMAILEASDPGTHSLGIAPCKDFGRVIPVDQCPSGSLQLVVPR